MTKVGMYSQNNTVTRDKVYFCR